MRITTTPHFDRAFMKAPAKVKRAFSKQIDLLLHDIGYPSLRAKKYDMIRWQARITKDWRFYFRIESDRYVILDMIHHPK